MNLTEATILALQGKLVENKIERPSRIQRTKKEESVAIGTDDVTVSVEDNKTEILTNKETITVVNNEVAVESTEQVEVPVEELPVEDVLPEETEEPTIDEIVDEEPVESLTENVEIDVDTEDGSVEVTTTEGEEVEVKDETIEEEETEEVEQPEESEEEEPLEESIAYNEKVTDYIDEEDLDKIIKENPNFKDCKNYEAVEDMILKVATDGYTDFNKSYKVVKHSDGKYYAYLIDDKNEKVGDEFILFESKEVKTESVEKKQEIAPLVAGAIGAGIGALASGLLNKKEGEDELDITFTSTEQALQVILKAVDYIAQTNVEVEATEEQPEEVVEPEEEVVEESINKDSFNKVLSEFYNKEIAINEIVKEGKDLKITGEGLSLTLTEADCKHNVTKYTLQESKEPMSMITLLKNNELQCKFITK